MSPMSPVPGSRSARVAVVGTGARSVIAHHVPRAWQGAEIVAAVEPSLRGQERAGTLFPGVPVFDDVSALLAGDRPDAAVVTSPDDTHADIAVELLHAGVAVYLEKPLATTLPDADRILTAAAESGSVLYVGHNFRHAGVVRRMKEIIDRGEIGTVKTIWVRHFVGNGGDYYFKDWHADRSHTNSLLLQKASHDLDVVHYLAGSYTRRVVGMGDLMVYGEIQDRRERPDETMPDWFSFDNWPPASSTGLNPVIDVEDVSMMLMTLESGVLASYEQCHFTPDYWRSYTVIGTEGRMENFGMSSDTGVIRIWNTRTEYNPVGDIEVPIPEAEGGHNGADPILFEEFFAFVREGRPTKTSPVAGRNAVAAAALATESLRDGSTPQRIPPVREEVLRHFAEQSL